MEKMNTYSTESVSTKPEPKYSVIDHNPTFSKVVSNCNRFEYLCITGSLFSSVLCFAVNVRTGMKPKFRDVTYCTTLCGMMYVFNGALRSSGDRLMGFLPNDDEVARLNNRELEKINTGITASTKQWYPAMSNAAITGFSLSASTCVALFTANCGDYRIQRFRISNLATCGMVFGATYACVNSILRIFCFESKIGDEMNREYPVIDGKPDFSKVVGNFNTLDYLRIPASTGYFAICHYHFGMKHALRGLVSGGLFGLLFGFGRSYMDSDGRLKGVFPNDGEVARFNKK